MIRILLADDQRLLREGLRTILDLEGDLKVVAEACDGEEAVRLALLHKPDVILMDVQMPRMNGLDASRKILQANKNSRILIVTTFDRDEYLFDAIRLGASGFLLKDAPAEQLIEAVKKVFAGETFIQPEIASRALKVNLQMQGGEALSDREKEVLSMIAQGVANKEVAARLNISEGTVKNHVSNILSKLQASNRTQAANIARQKGII